MGVEFNTQDMLDTYLFENTQLLENLQEIVLEQKDEECFDEDSMNEIFRTMHTIKGSSAIMMYDDITAIAHKLEDVFFYLRESHPQNVPHVELVEHVLEVADFITITIPSLLDKLAIYIFGVLLGHIPVEHAITLIKSDLLGEKMWEE